MQNLVITNAGQELMTSLITKGTTASFTKIATSEHTYKKEELGNLLALEDIKQEVAISKLEQKDASTIEITAAVTNEELTEGYYIKALGLYIKDNEGNEILYAVAIDDTPDYLPAFNNTAISNIIYRLNVKVSNSAQVTLEIAQDAYATAIQAKELQEQIDAITEKEENYAQKDGSNATGTWGIDISGNAATATKANTATTADSATKLNTDAGSATQPVYFKDGKPVETKYALEKSVPADAEFTDTVTVKNIEDTFIQLEDTLDANMLLNHAPVNVLDITVASQTVNGVTINISSSNTIKVSGTADDDIDINIGNFSITKGQVFSFGQTKSIDGSVGDDGTSLDNYMYYCGADGTDERKTDGIYTASVDNTINVNLCISNGTTVNCTYYPRVYLENKRCSYVPPSGYNIISCNKNLAKPAKGGWNNVTFTPTEDGGIKIKHSGASSDYYAIAQVYLEEGKTYVFKVDFKSTISDASSSVYRILIGNNHLVAPAQIFTRTFTAKLTGYVNIMCMFDKTKTDVFEDTLYIQCEVGSVETDFEPYEETLIPISADTQFPLEGLKSFDGITNVYNIFGAKMGISYTNNTAGKAILDGLADNTERIYNSVSDAWNSSKIYSVDEYCIYKNSLWKCLVEHSNQTPVEGDYWTKVNVSSELDKKANADGTNAEGSWDIDITGNSETATKATTADTATMATQDADGNVIADTYSKTGHTHNYAGSSSAGGAATSAEKLNTSAGSALAPVYFSNGVPVETKLKSTYIDVGSATSKTFTLIKNTSYLITIALGTYYRYYAGLLLCNSSSQDTWGTITLHDNTAERNVPVSLSVAWDSSSGTGKLTINFTDTGSSYGKYVRIISF